MFNGYGWPSLKELGLSTVSARIFFGTGWFPFFCGCRLLVGSWSTDRGEFDGRDHDQRVRLPAFFFLGASQADGSPTHPFVNGWPCGRRRCEIGGRQPPSRRRRLAGRPGTDFFLRSSRWSGPLQSGVRADFSRRQRPPRAGPLTGDSTEVEPKLSNTLTESSTVSRG